MAVYWSWAWGNETALQLNDEMGFNPSTTAAGNIAPRTDVIYTYLGSPTRYSLGTTSIRYIETPASAWINNGWVCVPIYATDTWRSDVSSAPIISSLGNEVSVRLYISNTTTGELTSNINGGGFNNTNSSAGFLTLNDWQYVALKYDLSTSNPTADVYVDGVLRVNGSVAWSDSPSTSGVYRTGGFSNQGSFPSAYIGQIIVYDTGSLASGNPYDPIFCSRVEPTIDETGVGTFTPSTGVDNYAVLDSPFDSSIYTANTSSNVGDRVVCQASGASGFYSQLGTTPTEIRGVTVHGWASGSGQDGFVGISDNNSTYDTGSHITPDISDPTYAYATAADQPSNAAAWNTGSLLYVKYEVS